jgi:putative lipase involved disintegration of autophagic bodies
MESKCHSGYECIYEEYAKKSSSLPFYEATTSPANIFSLPFSTRKSNGRVSITGTDIRYHSLDIVLSMIEGSETVPSCSVREACSECDNWTWI